MIKMHIDGFADLQRMMGEAGRPLLKRISLAVAVSVHGRLAKYPGKVVHPIQWKTARQRRFYFAMRRKAGLAMQYTRRSDPQSQRMVDRWAYEPYGDVGAVVGTTATYSPYVQDSDKQQPFHRNSGWVTDKQATEQTVASGDVERIVHGLVSKALGG